MHALINYYGKVYRKSGPFYELIGHGVFQTERWITPGLIDSILLLLEEKMKVRGRDAKYL